MFFKFCPFCQEIKPLEEFSLQYSEHRRPENENTGASFFCNDCLELCRNQNYLDSEIYKRKKILTKLRERTISRLKAAYDMSATECSMLLGISYPSYKKYLELFFTNDINWDNMNEWEIDHVKPVKSFDMSKRSERAKCFHFTNTKPIIKKQHREKGEHGPRNQLNAL